MDWTDSNCMLGLQQWIFYLFDSDSVVAGVLSRHFKENSLSLLKGLTFGLAAVSRLLLCQVISGGSRVAARGVSTQFLARIVRLRTELAREKNRGCQTSSGDGATNRGVGSSSHSGTNRNLLTCCNFLDTFRGLKWLLIFSDQLCNLWKIHP